METNTVSPRILYRALCGMHRALDNLYTATHDVNSEFARIALEEEAARVRATLHDIRKVAYQSDMVDVIAAAYATRRITNIHYGEGNISFRSPGRYAYLCNLRRHGLPDFDPRSNQPHLDFDVPF